MSVVGTLVSLTAFEWGWVAVVLWVFEQLYNPLWETKLQGFHNDLTTRLSKIEVVQISMAQEVEGVSDSEVSSLHDHDDLDPSDLKDNGSSRNIEEL